MTRRLVLVLVLVLVLEPLLSSPSALALDEVAASDFRPPTDPFGYVTVEGAKALAPGQPFAAAYFDAARRPLALGPGAGGARVRELESLDLAGGYGITSVGKGGGLEAGAELPIAVQDLYVDDAGARRTSGGAGDLLTDVKLDLKDRDDDFWGVAFRAHGTWPTGRQGGRFLAEDGAVALGGEADLEGKIDFLRAGLSLGAEWLDSKWVEGGPLLSREARVDDRIRVGFGFGLAPLRDIAGFETFELVFEATHWTLADRPWQAQSESPVVVGGAIRYNGRFFALAGASARVNGGTGAPDARAEVALGLSF